jgi:hypothetical protein
MITFLKRTGALVAVVATLALSPVAEAAQAGHPSGGIHIGGGAGGGGGGAPVGIMPHHIAPAHPGGGVKHIYGGNGPGPVGLAPHHKPNSLPGVATQHPGGGINKHWDHKGDNDGDHHEHHAHHRHHLFVYGVPYYDNFYDDSYGDTCGYYWRRYQQTGNPKWKWRYYDCIG